ALSSASPIRARERCIRKTAETSRVSDDHTEQQIDQASIADVPRSTNSPSAPARNVSPARRNRASAFEQSPDFVQSLARGLSIVRAFDREHPALSLSEVAARVGLARAAARPCLLTLQHLGYVILRRRSFLLL